MRPKKKKLGTRALNLLIHRHKSVQIDMFIACDGSLCADGDHFFDGFFTVFTFSISSPDCIQQQDGFETKFNGVNNGVFDAVVCCQSACENSFRSSLAEFFF